MTKVHTVVKGDTLTKIATKYGVSVAEIQKANSLVKDKDIIKIGWKLTIPDTGSKGYEQIGRQFQRALNDIRNLTSVSKLKDMMK